MPTTRIIIDIGSKKQDVSKELVKALNRKENHRKIAEFAAHVISPQASETVGGKVVAFGSHVHVHEAEGFSCDTCIEASGKKVFVRYED